MTTLRTILRVIIFVIMPVLIVAWVLMMALNTTVLNPQTVKGWASNSGIYDNFTHQIVDLEDELDNQAHIDVPTLQKAIDQTFPSSYIQQHGEVIIDATYAWLRGETSQPTFTVPIDQKKEEFAERLKMLLEPQFASYPRCPLTMLSMRDFWNTKCLPQGHTSESYAELVSNEAVEETSFFEQSFTGQDLELGSDMRQIPQYISMFMTVLWIVSISIVVLAALYLLLSVQRLRGVGRLGRLLFICGLVTLLGGVIVWVFGAPISNIAQEALESTMQDIVGPLITTAVPSLGMWVSIYSAGIVVTGLALWIISHFISRQKKRTDETQVPTPPVQSSVPPTTPTPPTSGGSGQL